MNKLYSAVSFLVVLVVGVISSAAADGWRTGLSATYPGVSFNDVHYVNATTAWAVGSKGVVLKTTDGGATWCSASDPWGPVCQLTIDNTLATLLRALAMTRCGRASSQLTSGRQFWVSRGESKRRSAVGAEV